jgi:hypothetical protein
MVVLQPALQLAGPVTVRGNAPEDRGMAMAAGSYTVTASYRQYSEAIARAVTRALEASSPGSGEPRTLEIEVLHMAVLMGGPVHCVVDGKVTTGGRTVHGIQGGASGATVRHACEDAVAGTARAILENQEVADYLQGIERPVVAEPVVEAAPVPAAAAPSAALPAAAAPAAGATAAQPRPAAAPGASLSDEEVFARLRAVKDLRQRNVISEEEYQAERRRLLGQLER